MPNTGADTSIIILILASTVWLTLLLLNLGRKIMAAIDDLKAADAAETAELSTLQQAQQDEVTRVNTLIATLQNNPSESDIASVAADLQAHIQNMQTIASALTAVQPAPSSPS